MAQIRKGTTYATGDPVTATNLNALVDNAFLIAGAVNDQPTTNVVSLTDKTLLAQGNALSSVTVDVLKAAIAPDVTPFLKKDGSVPLNDGAQLTLGNSVPTVALHATSKGYVDAANATRLPLAGGTLTGALTLSADPTVALGAVTKQYVDSIVSCKCRGYFSSTTSINPPSNILDESRFLTCQASRSAGSGILTISFSSLDARYKSSTDPFFLVGQYIGTKTVTGITARLYRITEVNYSSSTLTITTPETTAFSGAVLLSCVYDNSTNADAGAFNCKSVYLCYASHKHYVNYWKDTVTGSKTNTAPTEFFNTVVTGQGSTYNYEQLKCTLMIDLFQRNAWQFNQDVPEGFGSFSTGCHIGYFYNNSNGSDYPYQYRATFLMT